MASGMTLQTDFADWYEDKSGLWLSLHVKDRHKAARIAQEVRCKVFDVTIAEHKRKRSLDANAYAWKLMDELATVVGIPKTSIYKGFVKEIGGNSEIVCVKESAAESLCNGWGHNGVGWITEVAPSKLSGCVNVTLYYGSSTYDTSQMSRLINLIVDECKEQGIETMTPDEISKLKGLCDE